jgi:hypothetical protein
MVKRRDFLKIVTAALIGKGMFGSALAADFALPDPPPASSKDGHIKDYLYKIRNFNAFHQQDVFLDGHDRRLLKATVQRLRRLERTVGHGNFYLLNFDDALKNASYLTEVGDFTQAEIDFLERLFYQDARRYGFLGQKPLQKITDAVDRSKAVRISQTGNYVYQGASLETFQRIRKDVGDEVVLTSGLRSIPKQFLLFLNKAYHHSGNLSLASRSLAPPGYSYHGIGDFDVGHVKLGSDNFTLRFTETDVYRQLRNLGYIELRYHEDNHLGVRFEPWHIKVHTAA